MRIYYEQREGLYCILNDGRVIRKYHDLSAFYEGQRIMIQLAAQVTRATMPCSCTNIRVPGAGQ